MTEGGHVNRKTAGLSVTKEWKRSTSGNDNSLAGLVIVC